MAEKVKIFIACSGRAKNEAQFLATKLDEVSLPNIEIKSVRWWTTGGEISTIIEKLINQTNLCDFAVILLTKDDLLHKANNDELAPRDNCVFEAGLFTGAFGPNFKRCFLLVSVNQETLPTDLKGVEYIKISEYNGENNNQDAKDSLERAANRIGEAISNFKETTGLHVNRGLKRPIITAHKLQELESLSFWGGNLKQGSTVVLVRSPQPLEVTEEFAKPVLTNMVNGITYKYIFDKDEETIGVIVDLITTLIGIKKAIKRDGKKDVELNLSPDLNIITIQKLLRIYFLPDKPGIHYCIHNANRGPDAICYLKCPDDDSQFIEWCRADKAEQICKELNRLFKDPPRSEKYIFNRSIHCNLYDSTNQAFLSDLETELKDKLEPLGISLTQIRTIFFKSTVINEPHNSNQVGQLLCSTKEEKHYKVQVPELVNPERTIRIFLASSSELQEDRDEFDLYFRRLNDKLRKRGVYLEIIRWENFLDAMSETRLQDEYNQEVRNCDIFVSLFFSKTGKYTEEEFDTAHKQFMSTKKPLIYTFFKNASLNANSIGDEIISLLNFKKKLASLGHFYTSYENIQDLKQRFNDQLDTLLDKGI